MSGPAPRPRAGRGERGAAAGGTGTPGTPALARGVLAACRPRQWTKNLLVLAAPALAGRIADPAVMGWTALAFALFCVAAGGTYLLNDAVDAADDRAHERKRHRPVASGLVPVPLAAGLGAVLVGLAPLAALLAQNLRLAAVLLGYLALTVLYTLWLKNLPVCDIVAVAGCHVLRALAGGLAVGLPITSWFLVVVSLGALLVVAGKREAELRNPASGGGRAALAHYTTGYLAQVRAMASGAVVVTYCLWALDEHTGAALGLYTASIVPFVMIVLRLHLLVERGVGEEPEEIALRDRPAQVLLAGLLVLVGLGVHLG
ncbi:decaprenyl-phosphate phosphoribosyltransferase [Actinorugispora endophytica]|uniref:Decaprenyl-phosphate phosphoribosyltransferase n=1 Tax=Actinorugispora endophytica TaxID=1605990 RepID=A0A4V3D8K3_9ACTN|nr:decaprenyl-phosphate phosphoribosyltransferase [Actinorugispora endophytica]TDQ52007.1 decaprenyl-phosphate phosphoribosyltransferase [Actinorugispora endophytica]